MDKAKELDQFFTSDDVALKCLEEFMKLASQLGYSDLKAVHFLEPSAGGGAFLRALDDKNLGWTGWDIDPQAKGVIENDFLRGENPALPNREIITIGNPPFGKRARLAIDFINRALEISETVAFIVPLQFNKYSAQSKINQRARLVWSVNLASDSFVYCGEEYSVRCCFQVWTLRSGLADLRLRHAPQIKHPDFEMWQYNNTRQAEKYFNKKEYGWDFAVPRQGYKDYTIQESDPDLMGRRTQWIFFKAKSPEILARLKALDFEKLSHKNTSTPGFGKADVIEEYKRLYDSSVISTEIQTFQLDEPKPSLAGNLSLLDL